MTSNQKIDALELLKEHFEDTPYFGVDRDSRGLCFSIDYLYMRDKISKDQYNYLDALVASASNQDSYYWPLDETGDKQRLEWIDEKIKEVKDAKS